MIDSSVIQTPKVLSNKLFSHQFDWVNVPVVCWVQMPMTVRDVQMMKAKLPIEKEG